MQKRRQTYSRQEGVSFEFSEYLIDNNTLYVFRYCGSTAPDAVTLTGKAARKGLRVLFASDKKNVGTGAQCTAVCLDGAATTTTAAPTTAAPTTTAG